MAGFYDANYNITKLEKTNGVITKLALNGQEVPLGAIVEDKKAATIDVSTYTEPVNVTPTNGKDAMKKAIITLSNIPTPDINEVYAAKASLHDVNFIILSDKTLSDIAYYSGEETDIDDALEDTEHWTDYSIIFSSHVGNTYVTSILDNNTFIKVTYDEEVIGINPSSITTSFTKIN